MSTGYTSRLARDYEIPVRGQKDHNVSQHPVLARDWLSDRALGQHAMQPTAPGWNAIAVIRAENLHMF